ncbi:Hypothetical predicted protein [Olea europaea subsp. europaea]|uniref:Uncharacterized protein n=1 Tax=Olea europaea subsp. europaea TaxID=158383 RepID=A0A8S0T532_OLEEU|nr:Hypothetical predicted protein [Olea europaea subsp. europaea]
MATPLWHNSGSRTKCASTAEAGGEGPLELPRQLLPEAGGGGKRFLPPVKIRSRRKRLPLRLHPTEATGASVAVGAPAADLGLVFSLTRRVVLGPPRPRGIEIEWHVGRNAAATEGSVAVGAPGPDLGPVFSLTRRVLLGPPRSRGIEIEIEWHVGRNAGATGASVAVEFNTETKGDRDGEACWSVVAGLF